MLIFFAIFLAYTISTLQKVSGRIEAIIQEDRKVFPIQTDIAPIAKALDKTAISLVFEYDKTTDSFADFGCNDFTAQVEFVNREGAFISLPCKQETTEIWFNLTGMSAQGTVNFAQSDMLRLGTACIKGRNFLIAQVGNGWNWAIINMHMLLHKKSDDVWQMFKDRSYDEQSFMLVEQAETGIMLKDVNGQPYPDICVELELKQLYEEHEVYYKSAWDALAEIGGLLSFGSIPAAFFYFAHERLFNYKLRVLFDEKRGQHHQKPLSIKKPDDWCNKLHTLIYMSEEEKSVDKEFVNVMSYENSLDMILKQTPPANFNAQMTECV